VRPASHPARPIREVNGTALLVLVALLVGALVAACGASGSGSAAAPGSPGSSEAGSSEAAPPGASGSAGADASPSGKWPGDVVEAVLNLATADGQIQQAGNDLDAAANSHDLKAMWGAADGLATLLHKLDFEVSRIKDFPETQPLHAAYSTALPDMEGGAQQLRDAITNGDAAGITAGSARLAKGLQEYSQVRDLLGPLAQEALQQKRLLVK
jgi:hypothetical protein